MQPSGLRLRSKIAPATRGRVIQRPLSFRPPPHFFFLAGSAAAATLRAGTNTTSDHSPFSSDSMRPITCSQRGVCGARVKRCAAKSADAAGAARRSAVFQQQCPLTSSSDPTSTRGSFCRAGCQGADKFAELGAKTALEQAQPNIQMQTRNWLCMPPPPLPVPTHLVAGRLLQPLLVLGHPLLRLVRLALRRLPLPVRLGRLQLQGNGGQHLSCLLFLVKGPKTHHVHPAKHIVTHPIIMYTTKQQGWGPPPSVPPPPRRVRAPPCRVSPAARLHPCCCMPPPALRPGPPCCKRHGWRAATTVTNGSD